MNFRSHKKMTLSATDEFWHSPILPLQDDDHSSKKYDTTTSATTSATTATLPTTISNANNDYFDFVLPPAHHQFFCRGAQDQCTSYEDLKGYDHTQADDDAVDYDYDDDYDDDIDTNNGGCDSLDESLFFRRQTPMTMMPTSAAKKEQGPALWLMMALQREEEEECDNHDGGDDPYMVPGLVRVPSGSSLESDDASSSSSVDDTVPTEQQEQQLTQPQPQRRGVSFSSTVIIQPIPHSSELTPAQHRKMYTTCVEVRRNKVRSKKEYRFEKCSWKNATEEWEMGVDVITGDLIHPAHARK